MKKLNFYFVVFFCSLIASSGIAIAQTEIVVDEGYNTLIVALNENPGETLILKRGGSYVIDQSAEITVATMIKGETTPVDTAPAVVSFFADPGAVDMNALFLVGADFIIKDVGLIGFTFDEQKIGPLLQVSAKDINITMDGCVVQNAYQILETNGNDSLTIVQKNCKFMNLVNDGFDNWGGYGCMWGGGQLNLYKY